MLARNTIRINAYETDVFPALSSIESLVRLLLQLHFNGSSTVSPPVTDTSFQWFIQGVTTGYGHLISKLNVFHFCIRRRSRKPQSLVVTTRFRSLHPTHTHARTHARTHALTHARTHACTHTRTHHNNTHTHTHTHTHARTHARTHAHIHTRPINWRHTSKQRSNIRCNFFI